MKKVLIGTVHVEKDTIMLNQQFTYAADFEELNVKAGDYPVYTYADELERHDDRVILGHGTHYIGFTGTLVRSSFKGTPGEETHFHPMCYAYQLADGFLRGHELFQGVRLDYTLRPEWGMFVDECAYDGKRLFSVKLSATADKLTFIE